MEPHSNQTVNEPHRPVGHRARVAGLLVAVVSAAGVGIWMAPASADVQQTAAALETQFPADEGDRGELRKNLKDARELEGDERREALKGIHDDARDGKYGDRVDRRVERRGDHRAAFFALLPDEMQADLKKAKETDDPEDRKAERQDICEKALDGGYGEKVQQAFELLEKNRRH